MELKRTDARQANANHSAERGQRQQVQHRGKLFDETGDRLTPSHSRSRKGRWLRYYISHRLVGASGEQQTGGWRLPALELEARVAARVRSRFQAQGAAATFLNAACAGLIQKFAARLSLLAQCDDTDLLALTDRVDLVPSEIAIKLDTAALAGLLEFAADQIDEAHLLNFHLFQLRKRGVETKIILSDEPVGRDGTLIRNVDRAHDWFSRIKSGQTFSEIARFEGASNRRVQQMLSLAFLAPDLVSDILSGRQPIGFTLDWFMRHDLPSDWYEQRALLATL